MVVSLRVSPALRASNSAALCALLAALLAVLAPAARGAAPCHQSKWLAKYACEKPVISKIPYANLRKDIADYLDKKEKDGVLIDAGVYFRDLKDGPHFGINEYANYAAGSLLKLPVVIQFLMLAEEDPKLLALELAIPEGLDGLYNVLYVPPQKLAAGERHTIDNLLYRTIAYSDNIAFITLRQYLIDHFGSESFIWESYRQLGLVPHVVDRDHVITVSRYASLFKLLYSASILSSQMSEKLVLMLQAATFDVGLVRGLPKGVPVANKFGEMTREDMVQLHDCGIIYYPDNPYVLCVMTRGHKNTELEDVIEDVSRMVYREVDGRRGRLP